MARLLEVTGMSVPAARWDSEDFDADACLRQMLAISGRLQSLPLPDDVTLAHLAGCLAQLTVDMHHHMRSGGLAPADWANEE